MAQSKIPRGLENTISIWVILIFICTFITTLRHAFETRNQTVMSWKLHSGEDNFNATDQCEEKLSTNFKNRSTTSFLNQTAETIRQFYRNTLRWNSEQISITDIEDIIRTDLKIQASNYTITFGNISFRTPLEDHFNTEIVCQFDDNLKLKIPTNGSIKLDGEIYETRSNTTTRYKVILEDAEFIHTRNINSSNTDITYKNFHIDVRTDSNHKLMVNAVNQLLEEIIPSLKSKINEKFTQFAEDSASFRNTFTACMNTNTNSKSLGQDYFVINGSFVETWENLNIRLKISSVILKGLSRMKTIRFHPNSDTHFTLFFNTIVGYANWTYMRIGYPEESQNVRFKIDDLTVTGIMESDQISHLFYDFTPKIICLESKHELTSFAEVIVLEKITQILTSSFSYTRIYSNSS